MEVLESLSCSVAQNPRAESEVAEADTLTIGTARPLHEHVHVYRENIGVGTQIRTCVTSFWLMQLTS